MYPFRPASVASLPLSQEQDQTCSWNLLRNESQSLFVSIIYLRPRVRLVSLVLGRTGRWNTPYPNAGGTASRGRTWCTVLRDVVVVYYRGSRQADFINSHDQHYRQPDLELLFGQLSRQLCRTKARHRPL